MTVSEQILTMFSATIETRNGEAVVSVPERELDVGELEREETYRVAVFPKPEPTPETAPPTRSDRSETSPEGVAPVDVGDTLTVEIEDVGDQGDGIARIGPGYVVFVPGTAVGDRVEIEITKARENYAFAEVVEPEPLS